MRDEHGAHARRVCIITPTHLGSTPRVVKEAQALHDSGLEVTVIAVRTRDSVEVRDGAILKRAAWRTKRIDLRSFWRRLPSRIVQAAAGTVHVVWRTELGVSALTTHLTAAAVATPANLFIAHYPAALPAAAAAARAHAARLAFDAEDFHPGELPDGPAHDDARRGIAHVEQRYLPQCAYVTAASPGIADAYAMTYGIERPTVVLNTFPQAERAAAPCGGEARRRGPSLYWFSQVVGQDRGIECAIQATGRAASRPHLYLRGDLASGFGTAIEALAIEAGATDRVHLLEPAAPEEMVRLATEFDAGLVAETGHTLNRRIALTNKLFTYLAAGVPAVMSDVDAHCSFARDAGVGDWLYGANDAESLAARLDHWFGEPCRLAMAQARAVELSQERYHWEVDRDVLVATVTRALSAPWNAAPRRVGESWRTARA